MRFKEQPEESQFQPNGFYERLIELRRTNRKAFDSISPVSRMALVEYEKQKREYERLKALREEAGLPPAA